MTIAEAGSSGDGDELIRPVGSNPGPSCTGRARAYSTKKRFEMIVEMEDLKAAKAKEIGLPTKSGVDQPFGGS